MSDFENNTIIRSMTNQYKYSLLGTFIICILLIMWTQPEIFLGIFIIAIFGYILIGKLLIPTIDSINVDGDNASRRKAALKMANIYLAPYNNIWKNLKLSNKYCRLELGSDGVTITCVEKRYPWRTFRILSSHVHEYTDLWDMFCVNFSHNKTFDGLLEDCKLYKVSIECKGQTSKPVTSQEPKKTVYDKLDINNCSEIELTELPGVSIVMAKKAVKKRDEIGGFKTIEDFFLFLKLKPHMQTQLRDRICLNKMKNARKKIERSAERKVDL